MNEFGKGVRDFIYLPQYETGFVALSDMNILSRMDSYFTNVSNFYDHISLDVTTLGKERVERKEVCLE